MLKTLWKKKPTLKVEPSTIAMLVILLSMLTRLITLFAGWM